VICSTIEKREILLDLRNRRCRLLRVF